MKIGLPSLYDWKDMWPASMATETGPTVATASFRASSSPDGMSTNPLSVAPMLDDLNLHFSSLKKTLHQSVNKIWSNMLISDKSKSSSKFIF